MTVEVDYVGDYFRVPYTWPLGIPSPYEIWFCVTDVLSRDEQGRISRATIEIDVSKSLGIPDGWEP